MSLTIENQIELLLAGNPLEIDDTYEACHAAQNDILGKNIFIYTYVCTYSHTHKYIYIFFFFFTYIL